LYLMTILMFYFDVIRSTCVYDAQLTSVCNGVLSFSTCSKFRFGRHGAILSWGKRYYPHN